MLLTLDLGNTNLTIGVFNGEELVCECRLATDRSRTGDQYAVELLSMRCCARRCNGSSVLTRCLSVPVSRPV